jgi:hypothetical protein
MAAYAGGSGTAELLFDYLVKGGDRNSTDLGVLGLAENDAVICDAAGNLADVRIDVGAQGNNLSASHNIVIRAQVPYVRL